jgi:hypothetical protein
MRPSRRALLVTFAPLLAACGGGEGGRMSTAPEATDRPGTTVAVDTVAPRLRDLGVTFAPYDAATGHAGAFDFGAAPLVGPMGAFGRRVSDPQGQIKSLPTYDYFVAPGTVLRAPFDGVVAWARYQADSKDYELLVTKSRTSPWYFDLDHVSRVLVDSGATVKAGQPVAVVQTFTSQGKEYGFTELMIGSYATHLAYCPLDYAEPAAADSLTRAVERLYADWRAQGHAADTTTMVRPGCYTRTEVP